MIPVAMRGAPYPYVSRSRLSSWDLGDTACLVVPALMFLRVNVQGVVFATDFCLLGILLLFLARRTGEARNGKVRTACLLGLAWLAAQLFTDFVRDTPLTQCIRGWGMISLTVTHLLTVAMLIRRSLKRLALYGAGLAVGGLLTYFFTPGEYAVSLPWKFGLGIPVTLLVCLLSSVVAFRWRLAAVTLVLLIGAVNVYLGFRSLGGICLATAVFCQARFTYRTAGARAAILSSVALLVGAWAITAVYAYSATGGALGDRARQTYLSQSRGEGGILLGGRSDLIGATAAIMDSPLIGHGSWARDPEYAALEADVLSEMGYRNALVLRDPDLIPSHSHLFGAWVTAGILGAAFWIWVVWLTVRALLPASGSEPLYPFLVFVALLLIWDTFLSPYGAEQRFQETYSIYAMIFLSRLARNRSSHRAYVQGVHSYRLVQPGRIPGTRNPVRS
jgi:hypothetical protein